LTANKATNNARQIFAQVVGQPSTSSDGGLQLSIGGRGLDPNRTSNFNTRQNGYDISADVLGYPESYYATYRSFRRNTSYSWSRLFAIRYTIWWFSELQDKITD
jgi:hypothetical protein